LQRQVVAGALADATTTVRIRHHSGDEVELLERLDVSYPPLWLYGAGHVGQALVRILADLPLQLTWIDSRSAIFPLQAPATVRLLHSAEPLESVAAAPAGARYLVMTHSHALDFALCRAILSRSDVAWAGLIGSKSKAARFRSRLTRAGISADAIARLVCPIGIGGIDSKWPAAIAVAVAAELLRDISGVAAEGSRTEASAEPSVAAACSTPRCAGCETS
jgi:xanthine dehydrogenase accessory factor